MRGASRMGGGLLALILLLAACMGTPALIPTSTPAPTATPESLILPEHFRFEALGYRLSLDYPAGWQADRWAQSAAVVASNPAGLPQAGLRLFYHVVPPEGQTFDTLQTVRWRALWLPEAEEGRRMSSDYFRGEPLDRIAEVIPFEWGGYPAAYFAYRYQDDTWGAPVQKYQVILQLPEENSALLLWVAVPEADLADLEPVLRAMLASLVFNDTPLPVEPVLAAAAMGNALQTIPTPESGDAPRDSWVGATPPPF